MKPRTGSATQTQGKDPSAKLIRKQTRPKKAVVQGPPLNQWTLSHTVGQTIPIQQPQGAQAQPGAVGPQSQATSSAISQPPLPGTSNKFDYLHCTLAQLQGLGLPAFKTAVRDLMSNVDLVELSHASLNSSILDVAARTTVALQLLALSNVSADINTDLDTMTEKIGSGDGPTVVSELFIIQVAPVFPILPEQCVVSPGIPSLRSVNVKSAIVTVGSATAKGRVKGKILRDMIREVAKEVFKQAILPGCTEKWTSAERTQIGMTCMPKHFILGIAKVITHYIGVCEGLDLSELAIKEAIASAQRAGPGFWLDYVLKAIAYVLKQGPNRKKENRWIQYPYEDYLAYWELDENFLVNSRVSAIITPPPTSTASPDSNASRTVDNSQNHQPARTGTTPLPSLPTTQASGPFMRSPMSNMNGTPPSSARALFSPSTPIAAQSHAGAATNSPLNGGFSASSLSMSSQSPNLQQAPMFSSIMPSPYQWTNLAAVAPAPSSMTPASGSMTPASGSMTPAYGSMTPSSGLMVPGCSSMSNVYGTLDGGRVLSLDKM